MASIDRLMEDSVDIHVHFDPDPRVERRSDALEIAQMAKDMGMRGLVLKSHEYPTHPVAFTVSKVVPGISLMGGVCLDEEVGGINAAAVEASARMGARMVWMPTFASQADKRRKGLPGGICILDQEGKLVPEVYPVLESVKAHDMALATGHLSTQESMALVDEAKAMGINRVVVTHGTSMMFMTGMTTEDMIALAAKGAYIEHSVHVMMPLGFGMEAKQLADTIRTIGAEHCIVSSDFGQAFHPMPPEGMRMGIATLLEAGLEDVEVGLMVKDNPSRLMGL